MDKIYQPTIVIGLGGTGKNILLSLKKIIAENSPKGMADYPFLRILSIDTDVSASSNKSSIETIDIRDLSLDQNKEIFQLASDFVSIPDLNSFPEIKTWFPSRLSHGLLPAELNRGAGMKKPIGRFSFAWNANNLYNVVKNLITNIVAISTTKDRPEIGGSERLKTINVFICGSLSGGTGAGCFIDTAYMIRDISASTGKKIYIYGLFALDTIFEGIQGDIQIKPNCYASLVELDHFSNELTFMNPYQQFRPLYKNFNYDYQKSIENKPFDFPFLFDKTNQDGKAFGSLSGFADMAARFIYLLTGHEVSDYYNSMDSNVRISIEQDYKKELLNKPSIYRSMGSYSIVFPKRMVIQLCGYLLTNMILKTLLNDDYKDYEIDKYTTSFLSKYKLNPKNNQLEEHFNTYKLPDDTQLKFSDYIIKAADELEIPADKKELIPTFQDFFNNLETDLSSFKTQIRPGAKILKKNFISYLNDELEKLFDLKEIEDASNEKRTRGSVKRAERFIQELIRIFSEEKEKYRKEEEEAANRLDQIKNDFSCTLDDMQEAISSLLPKGGKLKTLINDVLDICVDYFETAKKEYISSQLHQFINNLLDKTGAIDEPGILDELEKRNKLIHKIVNDFTLIKGKVNEVLDKNRTYDTGSFMEVLFNFKIDVEGSFKNLLDDKGENYLYEVISDNLKQKYFGNYYEKIENLSSMLILRNILKESELIFYDSINMIDIEQRILDNPDVRRKFKNMNYLTNAGVFVGLDGQELSRSGLQLDRTRFFAMTIPDSYVGKPCVELKGSVATQAGKRICPMDENLDKFKEEPCPKYGNCLKQILLANSPLNLAIIPCDDKSEVNIIQTIAGFPLHALFSAVKGSRNFYIKLKEKNDAENKRTGLQEESLHMFGPMTMPDIIEKTKDTFAKIREFKTFMLTAYAFNWLVIEKLSIKFFQQKDLQFKREEPTLYLGRNIEEVIHKMQSNIVEDTEIINQFIKETKLRMESVRKSDKEEKYYNRLQKIYTEIISGTNVPYGFVMDDAELINAYSVDTFGKKLVEENTGPIVIDKF